MINSRKKVIIGMGHPAHFHLFKNIIFENKYDITIVISDKDILIDLLESNHINFIKLANRSQSKNIVLKFFKLLFSSLKLIRIIRKKKPDLLIGCLSQIGWAGWLCNKRVLFFAEDDYAYTKIQGKITYPFVSHIITAEGVNVGPFSKKQLTYPSYQKLAYLHPENFIEKNKNDLFIKYQITKDYYLIRLVNLSAHHDKNIGGISHLELEKILKRLGNNFQIFISSEKNLSDKWSSYQIEIDVNDMHLLMKNARGIISDSQSMTVEAALLGVPNIRINDFKNKISIINELEYTFHLTKSYLPNELSIQELDEFMSQDRKAWEERTKILLQKKINPIPFYYKVIEQ